MKDIDLRYYVYTNGDLGQMMFTSLSKFDLSQFPAARKSRPMPFTGVHDVEKVKIYEFDHLEFVADDIKVIGEVQYICKLTYNGFRVVSLDKKSHSWALSPLFIQSNNPKIVGHRYLKTP